MTEVSGGWLVFGTKIDNSKLENDWKNLERELKKKNQEAEKLLVMKNKYEADTREYEKEIKAYEKLDLKADDYRKKISELTAERKKSVSEGMIVGSQDWQGITTKIKEYKADLEGITQQLEAGSNNYIKINDKLEETKKKISDINGKLDENTQKQEKIKSKIIDIREKISGIKFSEKMNEKMEDFENSVTNITGKIGKWVVSLFTVASVFSLVRKAASTALQQNEGIGNRMSSVWNYLAELIMSLMETIINWILKALAILNYFLKALTGIDFAARVNERALARQTKATEKQRKATEKQAAAQKKLNEQITKFDEITKLTDEQNTTSNAASSDLGYMGEIQLPELDENLKGKIEEIADVIKNVWEWLKPVREIVKEIIDYFIEHPGAFLAVFGGYEITKFIAKIIGVSGGTTGLYGIIAALAILEGIELISLYNNLKDLRGMTEKNVMQANLLKDSWKDFEEQLKNSNITTEIAKKQIQFLTTTLGDDITAMSKARGEMNGLQLRVEILSGAFGENKKVLDGEIEGMKNQKDAMFESWKQSDKNNEITEAMIDYLTKYKDQLITTNANLGQNNEVAMLYSDTMKDNNKKIHEADIQLQYLNYRLKGGTKDFDTYKKEVEKANKKLDDTSKKMDNLKDKKATVKVDADTSQAETKTKNWLSGISNWFTNVGFSIKKGNSYWRQGGIAYYDPVKLASGAIVNQPGRGVPLRGAITGEAGAEGIFPLTDSQQMELLGEAIGRYVTINTTLNNYMNSRLISREIQKTNNESDFAFNR